MSKKIRDVVHGYIYITPFEELITENALFLRLHYIHQNSFTYLTYPSAHNTRFSHSLGVMHLAGELFAKAYSGCSSDDLDRLIVSIEEELNSLKIEVRQGNSLVPLSITAIASEIFKGRSAAHFDNVVYAPFLKTRALVTVERDAASQQAAAALALVLFQSIRAAAMLHDVGHPPFSHIVEYALLEGLIKRRSMKSEFPGETYPEYQGHEHASQRIASEILSGGAFQGHRYRDRTPHFIGACAALTNLLLSNNKSGLSGLKDTLLSGDVDADRLDYVLRDAKSAGLPIDYDLERLIDSAFLRVSATGVEVSYRSGGLATIESFFSSRYDLYRWMIYHHDTTRRNLVVQRLIIRLLGIKDLDLPIRAIASKLAVAASGGPDANYHGYGRFLDSTFIEMMWDLSDLIDNKASLSNAETRIRFYLDVILQRSNFLFPSICKTPTDYAYLAQHVITEVHKNTKQPELIPVSEQDASLFTKTTADKAIERLNDLIRHRFNITVERAKSELSEHMGVIEARKDAEGIAKYRLAHEIEDAIQPLLDLRYPEKYQVFCYYFGSFRASLKSNLMVYPPDGGGEPIPISSLSPTIKMLEGAWSISPQLMLYVKMPSIEAARIADLSAKRRHELFCKIRDIAAQGLGKLLG